LIRPKSKSSIPDFLTSPHATSTLLKGSLHRLVAPPHHVDVAEFMAANG